MGVASQSHRGSETDPLLDGTTSYGASVGRALDRSRSQDGELFDNVPRQKRQLGAFSAGLIIFNVAIGTGIYATPSNILRSAGSVGVALIMWLIGSIIAAMGTAVFIELGTGLPRSGGIKNYLEFIYRRPKFLATCAFSVYSLITGMAAANSVVFSEYLLHSIAIPPTWFNTRLVAILCLTSICFIHGTSVKWGLRIQNALGMFKLVVLALVAGSGILCLMGVSGFRVRDGYEKPRNFEWDKFWEGSGTGVNAFVTGLYAVIWSFTGYAHANSALSEVKDPVRTIRRAAPIAMLSVGLVYTLINIAYFAVVSKNDILNSRRIIAALYFRNLYGPTTERALSAFIALSTLGNLFSGQFAQGRVIQELGREGILPYASVFASSKPFNAPLSALFLQYLVSSTFLLATPPGDAYLFLISLSSYCATLMNTLVAVGLLLLHTQTYQTVWGWDPPFRAPKIVVILFVISNLLLVAVPLMPPAPGSKTYDRLPYWSHSAAAFAVSTIGIGYWYIWGIWLPKKKGYKLKREWVIQEDGVSRCIFQKDFVRG